MTIPKSLKYLGILLLALLVSAYAAGIVYLRVKEHDLVFTREAAPNGLRPPADSLRLPYRTITFRTADSLRLAAWVIPANDSTSGLWVLLCHGQSGNVATTTRPEYYAYLRDIGVNIFAFDWRGFGVSEGSPTEEGFYRDATAAYEYLRNQLHVPADSIIIFGHSLGTGGAVELATRVPAAGLVLEGGPTSIANRGQELYPLLPVTLVASIRFNSIGRIRSIELPMLLMHAREDKRIPLAHGRALFAAAVSAKDRRFVDLAGGHHDAFIADKTRYFDAFAQFIARVRTGGI